MKEASRVKFYFAKYFFLAFGVLQWIAGVAMIIRYGAIPKIISAAFIFFTIGLLFNCVFLMIAAKLKRVAIGKKKVSIIEADKTRSYEWPEVKFIRFIPFFNLYTMKIRGKKGRIYFLPTTHSQALFGLFPTGLEIDDKKN